MACRSCSAGSRRMARSWWGGKASAVEDEPDLAHRPVRSGQEVMGQEQARLTVAEVESCLLGGLATCGLQRILAGVGVAAGELPQPVAIDRAQLNGAVVSVADVQAAVDGVMGNRLDVIGPGHRQRASRTSWAVVEGDRQDAQVFLLGRVDGAQSLQEFVGAGIGVDAAEVLGAEQLCEGGV